MDSRRKSRRRSLRFLKSAAAPPASSEPEENASASADVYGSVWMAEGDRQHCHSDAQHQQLRVCPQGDSNQPRECCDREADQVQTFQHRHDEKDKAQLPGQSEEILFAVGVSDSPRCHDENEQQRSPVWGEINRVLSLDSSGSVKDNNNIQSPNFKEKNYHVQNSCQNETDESLVVHQDKRNTELSDGVSECAESLSNNVNDSGQGSSGTELVRQQCSLGDSRKDKMLSNSGRENNRSWSLNPCNDTPETLRCAPQGAVLCSPHLSLSLKEPTPSATVDSSSSTSFTTQTPHSHPEKKNPGSFTATPELNESEVCSETSLDRGFCVEESPQILENSSLSNDAENQSLQNPVASPENVNSPVCSATLKEESAENAGSFSSDMLLSLTTLQTSDNLLCLDSTVSTKPDVISAVSYESVSSPACSFVSESQSTVTSAVSPEKKESVEEVYRDSVDGTISSDAALERSLTRNTDEEAATVEENGEGFSVLHIGGSFDTVYASKTEQDAKCIPCSIMNTSSEQLAESDNHSVLAGTTMSQNTSSQDDAIANPPLVSVETTVIGDGGVQLENVAVICKETDDAKADNVETIMGQTSKCLQMSSHSEHESEVVSQYDHSLFHMKESDNQETKDSKNKRKNRRRSACAKEFQLAMLAQQSSIDAPIPEFKTEELSSSSSACAIDIELSKTQSLSDVVMSESSSSLEKGPTADIHESAKTDQLHQECEMTEEEASSSVSSKKRRSAGPGKKAKRKSAKFQDTQGSTASALNQQLDSAVSACFTSDTELNNARGCLTAEGANTEQLTQERETTEEASEPSVSAKKRRRSAGGSGLKSTKRKSSDFQEMQTSTVDQDYDSSLYTKRRSSLRLYRQDIQHYATIIEEESGIEESEDTLRVERTEDAASISDRPTKSAGPDSDSEEAEDDFDFITPELENLYRNKNYNRPADKNWETIYESPSRQGKVISKQKLKRFIHFDEYRVPAAKLRRRLKKAVQNGWSAAAKKMKKKTEADVLRKMQELDRELSQLDS